MCDKTCIFCFFPIINKYLCLAKRSLLSEQPSYILKIIIILSVISGSLSPQQGTSSGCGWRNGLHYGGKLQIYRISSRGQPTMGGPPAWGLGEVLTTPHRKNISCYIIFTKKALVQALVNMVMNFWVP